MANDDLIVVRDFLLKGIPFDLSRPRFMDFQRQQIGDKTDADPRFPDRLRHVALEALERDEPDPICRGLTALAFVGAREDLPVIERFSTHSRPKISQFATTCLFEIRKKEGAA